MPVELIPIAQQIWDSKYRLKRPDGTPIDQTVEDTWMRVAAALAMAEDLVDRPMWVQRFYDVMEGFKFIPAGRHLAGAGTDRSVTLFNCFVMGMIPDSLDGIFSHLREAALTMQQGGGIGYDFSTLRPKGSRVRGVDADASGPLSFMDVWDAMCKTLMSAGARRGAMMACMRCDHPDILDFINAKHEVGRLTQFNMSVLVTDAFMEAVKNDGDWFLVFPQGPACWPEDPTCDKSHVFKTVKAHELWDAIMRSTYDHAEPGVIFIDRINKQNNLHYCEIISGTNPCGEQPLPPYGCCDLGSINLAALVKYPFTTQAHIDPNDLEWLVPLAVRMLDNAYNVSKFPLSSQMIEGTSKRRVGLGITGLGNALAMCGIRYGTMQAAQVAQSWMQSIEDRAYRASLDLAIEKGPFPLFDRDGWIDCDTFKRLPMRIRGEIAEHGMRNSHLMSIAPTGTISLFAGNVSGGIEPPFALTYTRKVLQKDGTRTEERVEDHAYALYMRLIAEKQIDYGRDLPPWFVTAQDLTPDEHLIMLAACQSRCDTSISKTINLPEIIDFESFKDVYTKAYELGCKSCTTHRPNDVVGSVLSVDVVPETVTESSMRLADPKDWEVATPSVFSVDEPDFKAIEKGFSESAFPFDNPEASPELIASRDRAVAAIDKETQRFLEQAAELGLKPEEATDLNKFWLREQEVKMAQSVIDRAVRNSPPPLDDVGGVPEETFDEKDPNGSIAVSDEELDRINRLLARPPEPNEDLKKLLTEPSVFEDDDEPDDLLPIRSEALTGRTYKLRWADGVSDHAYYVTINDDEEGRPFEVFVNSMSVDHQAWTAALTRMISAIFRRGGNVDFVVEELKAIHDPKGGAWIDKGYVPSLPAAIGGVIQKHLWRSSQDSERRTSGVETELNLRGVKLAEQAEDREADVAVPFMDRVIQQERETTAYHSAKYDSGVHCPKCRERTLTYSEGCARCSSCDWSRCG